MLLESRVIEQSGLRRFGGAFTSQPPAMGVVLAVLRLGTFTCVFIISQQINLRRAGLPRS